MKINNVNELNEFLEAVNSCTGEVWLESPEGDVFNLKSTLSQYVALGQLLSERGEYLELFCSDKKDEMNFLKFFNNHPDVVSVSFSANITMPNPISKKRA